MKVEQVMRRRFLRAVRPLQRFPTGFAQHLEIELPGR